MTRVRGWLSLVALIALSVGMPRQASATWSIVAVDPHTREVGAAGASCTPFVVGIVGLAPGRGAIVVQAASNPMARVRGVEMLNDGAAPAAIVRALRESQFDPENQQYGVVALGADSGAAYTGTQAFAESAIALGAGVAIQGNTLPSKEVVRAAMAAFSAAADSGKPLAERLLRALEAGAAAGGDRRCGRQTAHSAFLGVARPGDEPRRPYIRLIIPDQEESGVNPVQLLRHEYERWRSQAGVALRPVTPGATGVESGGFPGNMRVNLPLQRHSSPSRTSTASVNAGPRLQPSFRSATAQRPKALRSTLTTRSSHSTGMVRFTEGVPLCVAATPTPTALRHN